LANRQQSLFGVIVQDQGELSFLEKLKLGSSPISFHSLALLSMRRKVRSTQHLTRLRALQQTQNAAVRL